MGQTSRYTNMFEEKMYQTLLTRHLHLAMTSNWANCNHDYTYYVSSINISSKIFHDLTMN